MIQWLTVLAACQLAGEAAVQALHLPIPGPVLGMAILFAGLVWNRGVPEGLGKVADALLLNLQLLFVPAGVGVMVHFKLLAAEWLPLAAGLLVSTVMTIAVTAWVMSALSRKNAQPAGEKRP
jgi:holin-like protein